MKQGTATPAQADTRAGVTILELMIVLGILALLTTLALPRFTDSIVRNRRSDAMIALQLIATEQEKFYFENHTYAATLGDLNLRALSTDGYYLLSIVFADSLAFSARAAPVAGTSQARDGGFELRSDGMKGWDPGQDGTYECTWNQASRGSGC